MSTATSSLLQCWRIALLMLGTAVMRFGLRMKTYLLVGTCER